MQLPLGSLPSSPARRRSAWLLCAVSLLGCEQGTTYRDKLYPSTESSTSSSQPGTGSDSELGGSTAGRSGTGGDGDGQGKATSDECRPVHASDALPVRGSVLAGGEAVFTRDLFSKFQSQCGACHIEQSLGDPPYGVTWLSFKDKVDDAISSMMDDGPDFMPPSSTGGKPWSMRDQDSDTDPIVELVSLLRAWNDAGNPMDVFYPASDAGSGAGGSAYVMDPDVGLAMTNLGNCVPPTAMVGTADNRDKMDALDEMFAKATELPERLEQTDLFTLDAEQLARRGVVAYAPAYTLWADNAKKLRMVRVPRGQTIAFDPDTQMFSVPPNTRLYKTFLKHVIDQDGNESYRKMETRLIVSRPDLVNPDGSRKPQALFGTYAWNAQETEATLVRDPLRNGTPFRDRMVTYITDEKKAYDVISEGAPDLVEALAPKNETDPNKVLLRNYAIPGSERCIQCHMGAPNMSFVLGFTPLQLHRQALGTHGVIEPADKDELNQLQRLIDYGIISGMSSPAEVQLLENTQGSRKPRNQHELEAQGYMLGNCAHCHNPGGFPSITAPELRDVLDLQPSARGGVFQFPLDRTSPRLFRGDKQDVAIPYISPSLFDKGEVSLGADGTGLRKFGFAKTCGSPDAAKSADGAGAGTGASGDCPNGAESSLEPMHIYAPWRSLIYRNVDTPFSYVDDSAIFPHMPRNTPGYDCRSRQLLGSWMVSIPSRPTGGFFDSEDEEITATENDIQPYVEVAKGDELFERAVSEADKRVEAFKKSPRFSDCPAPQLDIIDPSVRDDPKKTKPNDFAVNDAHFQYDLPIPGREHWFVTDLTEAPGDWEPRRLDWQDVLKEDSSSFRNDSEKQTVETLLKANLRISGDDDLRSLALDDVPFGVWAQGKTPCDFPSSVPTVGSYKQDDKPRWMKGGKEYTPADSEHVYLISPGAQVFGLICRSCHGPQADSKSRLADTIADLTGGETRVANLRDGLFGPPDSPGMNIERVFGARAGQGLTAEDWAARYMAWMALGGTQRTIPEEVVRLVTINAVMGQQRGGHKQLESGSANMLDTARFLCGAVLHTNDTAYLDLDHLTLLTSLDDATYSTALVERNGDAEMWNRLCTLHNPQPVRVFGIRENNGQFSLVNDSSTVDMVTTFDLFKREGYAGAAVGDHTGAVQPALTEANLLPWCIAPNATLAPSFEQDWAQRHGADSKPPYCPAAWLADETNRLRQADVDIWKKRGAMNAGLAAFLYLEALGKGDKHPVPDYDHCEELTR